MLVRQTLVFDADDTLWENNILFERAFAAFHTWLERPDLDEPALRTLLAAAERVTIVDHGYGTASFLRSLRRVFEDLGGRDATDAEAAAIEAFGGPITRAEVELVPGVAETLAELATRHDLLLLTKGDPVEQQAKIDASTLAHHFRSTHIVRDKHVATYRQLVTEQGLDPGRTWMIGNSPRSDILPARAAGLNAVFVPNAHTWELELAELPADNGVLHLAALVDLTTHF